LATLLNEFRTKIEPGAIPDRFKGAQRGVDRLNFDFAVAQ
jgi:hypothetical protein